MYLPSDRSPFSSFPAIARGERWKVHQRFAEVGLSDRRGKSCRALLEPCHVTHIPGFTAEAVPRIPFLVRGDPAGRAAVRPAPVFEVARCRGARRIVGQSFYHAVAAAQTMPAVAGLAARRGWHS